MSYKIPLKVLQSHIAILGKTGSGKTITAKGAVETLLESGQRVCAIDPTGVWWGLKSSASGKKAAYPVVIFGGEHADFPLSRSNGAAIAEIVGTTNISSVIDTRLMGVAERTQFFTDFAENLLRRNKGPLHLVIDEAHLFAPQGRVNDPQSGKMVNAANQLVSLGRGLGLRIMMITQRPAKLHKDSLTQAETLIAMRVIAPQDRQAVKSWIGEMTDAGGEDVLNSLPKLPTGSGWIWSPENDILEVVKFPMIKTFDTSKAPTGEGAKIVLAEIDEKKIHKLLGEAGKDILADDPKRLKARIAELERQPKQTTGISQADFDKGVAAGEERGYNQALEHFKIVSDMSVEARDILAKIVTHLSKMPALKKTTPAKVIPAPAASPKTIAPVLGVHDGNLPEGEAKVLLAVAQHTGGCSREQITVLTGYKKSTRDLYLQKLQRRGAIEKTDGRLFATPSGVALLGSDFAPLPTGAALRSHWLDNLPEGERKVLEAVIAAYPERMARQAISDETGYMKSTRDLYIQKLARRQLITTETGTVRASDNLF